MSTRANIVIKEGNEILYFYRHSDGYPTGTVPTLEKLIELILTGAIRDNISQCAGHLIILGAMEYGNTPTGDFNNYSPTTWKVGAYEPTTNLHGDIEWLYILSLDERSLTQVNINSDLWDELYKQYERNEQE